MGAWSYLASHWKRIARTHNRQLHRTAVPKKYWRWQIQIRPTECTPRPPQHAAIWAKRTEFGDQTLCKKFIRLGNLCTAYLLLELHQQCNRLQLICTDKLRLRCNKQCTIWPPVCNRFVMITTSARITASITSNDAANERCLIGILQWDRDGLA